MVPVKKVNKANGRGYAPVSTSCVTPAAANLLFLLFLWNLRKQKIEKAAAVEVVVVAAFFFFFKREFHKNSVTVSPEKIERGLFFLFSSFTWKPQL